MRHVPRAALCAAALLIPVVGSAAVSIRLHTAADPPPLVIKQLQSELARITERADLDLAWNKPVREGATVIITLKGSCTASKRFVSQQALGWAEVVDGRVLPFISIDCSRVRAAIAAELERSDRAMWNVLLGRALARVAAHELHHALAGTRDHGETGLTRPTLRAADLVYGSFFLTKADVTPPPARVRRAARVAAVAPASKPPAAPVSEEGEYEPEPLELGR